VAAEVMVAPERMTVKPVVFVAGDDAARKPTALKLVEDTGFEARDAGPMRNARMLEYLALLYLDLAMVRGMSRSFAFALSWPKA
jgi:predicted dinucleotide-binding enzyme